LIIIFIKHNNNNSIVLLFHFLGLRRAVLISDLIDHYIPIMFSFQDRTNRCIKPLLPSMSFKSPLVQLSTNPSITQFHGKKYKKYHN